MDSARQDHVANQQNYGASPDVPASQSKEDDLNSVEKVSQNEAVVGVAGEEEDEDVIDIDNPDDLAAKGLKRIQIEGEEEEYLMDQEGNIYDLRGNFIGTTDDDGAEGGNPLGAGVAIGSNVDQQQLVDDEDVDFEEY